jgi:hypothetical protein
MSSPEQEVQEGRKKRTLLLLAGGAASLILPLLGVVYIKMSESKASRAANSSVMFDQREGGETKVNVSQTIVAPAPGSGSSLDFVKGSNNYFSDKTADATQASTTTTPAATPAAPAPETKTAAKKGGAKPFAMPKLQGTKSISNNFKANSPKGGAGLAGVADPQSGKDGTDMNELLKNIPGGIDNPEVQKLMKKK